MFVDQIFKIFISAETKTVHFVECRICLHVSLYNMIGMIKFHTQMLHV